MGANFSFQYNYCGCFAFLLCKWCFLCCKFGASWSNLHNFFLPLSWSLVQLTHFARFFSFPVSLCMEWSCTVHVMIMCSPPLHHMTNIQPSTCRLWATYLLLFLAYRIQATLCDTSVQYPGCGETRRGIIPNEICKYMKISRLVILQTIIFYTKDSWNRWMPNGLYPISHKLLMLHESYVFSMSLSFVFNFRLV